MERLLNISFDIVQEEHKYEPLKCELIMIRPHGMKDLWASRVALDYIQLSPFPNFMVQFIFFPKFTIPLFPFPWIMQVVMPKLTIYDVTMTNPDILNNNKVSLSSLISHLFSL